jgi:hypothetical protein
MVEKGVSLNSVVHYSKPKLLMYGLSWEWLVEELLVEIKSLWDYKQLEWSPIEWLLQWYFLTWKEKTPFKRVLRGLEIGYELFDREFSVKTSPLLKGVVTFSPLVHFCQFLVLQMCEEVGSVNFLCYRCVKRWALSIFSATDVWRGGLHLLFGHHKQWGLPQKQRVNPTVGVGTPACLP